MSVKSTAKLRKMEASKLICFVLIPIVVGVSTPQGEPIFIDCGSTTTNTAADGRIWVGDGKPNRINFTLSTPGFIAIPEVDFGEESKTYKTARIFTTAANYTFQVPPGNYYVRLHFRPFAFESIAVKHSNLSAFDVFSNHLKLLTNYNVSGEILRQNSLSSSSSNSTITATSLVKEYFLNISSSELFISFVPTPGSFAFVNAIEVVPVLNTMFFESATKAGGTASSLNLVDRGLETMFRLNVGGSEIDPALDRDLWRKWESDNIYMLMTNAARVVGNTSNISYSGCNGSGGNDSSSSSPAPLLVYSQARIMSNTDVVDKRINMSWKFEVDPKFEYLVRLHFCELLYDGVGQRVFRIYLNFRIAAENFDVFERACGKNKAYHTDFVDVVRPDQSGILWLQLGPDSLTTASGTDALLNGVEIFKLSQKGTLAHVSEKFGGLGGDSAGNVSKSRNTWVGVLAGIASIFTFSCLVVFCFCCRKKKKKTMAVKGGGGEPSGWHPLVLHSMLDSTNNAVAAKSAATTGRNRSLGCRSFTIPEITSATNNFSESLLIGTGGFGKVYKGTIDDGVLVAIKRAHTKSSLAEFETEIEMLSKLRHPHLVSMIGYCDEQNEMIMVYEFMANGTLQSRLFGTDPSSFPSVPLTWKQRLEACIGAARGLHYLHSTGAGSGTYTDRGIIHRDVKTTNILLDDNLVAKMADFGLSKTGPAFDRTHVSTAVRGSFGYLDPEYFRRQQLTEKSDVYSFGVVLFEVICARSVINPTLPKDQINLAEWAIRWQRQRSLETIVDPRLAGDYSMVSLAKFGEIAEKCLADEGKNRPSMGEVVSHLEHVLELHIAYLTSRLNTEMILPAPMPVVEMKNTTRLHWEVQEEEGEGRRMNE